jgi:DNA-binding response OmpR family regulator
MTVLGGSGSLPEDTRLLIVEDDPELGTGIKDFFAIEGYDVTWADEGNEALDELTSLPPYDLAILDVRLPNRSGFEVLRKAREAGVDVPVIMLTVLSDPDQKLRGFNLGADDYVAKPFDFPELQARVRAVLQRSEEQAPSVDAPYTADGFTIDFAEQEIRTENATIELTNVETKLLEYLVSRRGRTVSRKQLLRDVWDISGDIDTHTIDRHVSSLRRKIEPTPDDPTYLQTVTGVGYKFVD